MAVFGSYVDALQTAAILPALAVGNGLAFGPERPQGLPLHDGRRFLGHVTAHGLGVEPVALPTFLHMARHYTADLDSLALLHRSLGVEALALLGRELMRRFD